MAGWTRTTGWFEFLWIARWTSFLQKGLPARTANQLAPETSVTPVGSAMEPRAMGIAGPCGYLIEPPRESAESKQRKD